MKFFIKKLGSQESGYSGDIPDQRGKYILVPKRFWDFFPHLRETTLNDFAGVRLNIIGKDESVGVNYHYNNAKFFPEVLSRDHDERRLYRNNDLDRLLGLDRGIIFIVLKDQQNNFFATSIHVGEASYTEWEPFAAKANVAWEDLPSPLKDSLLLDSPCVTSPIVNLEEIAEDSIKITQRNRRQQTPHEGDPAAPLESLFRNQGDFKEFIRKMYGGKCAIRQKSLVKGHFEGLDAAHVKPHNQKGPLLPTNGILMSRDLHDCFERGLFTLDRSNRLEISSTIDPESPIAEFRGRRIKPLEKFMVYEPYKAYTEFHRKNIFKP